MGCFYCGEHHEGREAIMFKVGEMKAGVLYLFKDQAHKGRCALALKDHKKELCECDPQELADFADDLAKASGAVRPTVFFLRASSLMRSIFSIKSDRSTTRSRSIGKFARGSIFMSLPS